MRSHAEMSSADYNARRKAELQDRLSDAAIGVAVAEQQLTNGRERLRKLRAEYDQLLAIERRDG